MCGGVVSKNIRTITEYCKMKRGCTVVQQKTFLQLLALRFRQCIFCAQQCREKERNRGSAFELACYSFITKRGALEALSVLGQLIVLQLKSLLYLSQQF